MIKEEFKKIELECKFCKSRFEVWISENNLKNGAEEQLRKRFYRYCPVCKLLEEMKKRK